MRQPSDVHEGSDCDEAEKRCDGLVVARGDAAKMLDFVDEALDEVALLVAMLVVGDRLLSRSEGGDHGIGAEGEKGELVS